MKNLIVLPFKITSKILFVIALLVASIGGLIKHGPTELGIRLSKLRKALDEVKI